MCGEVTPHSETQQIIMNTLSTFTHAAYIIMNLTHSPFLQKILEKKLYVTGSEGNSM